MSYYGWKRYVSVAERRRKAEKAAAKARKAGADHAPIEPTRGAIAKTFWGKAWCDNLEAYSDYANRLPRGRTYVRNGSVIDLKIGAGEVQAQVIGSSLYKVAVKVSEVPAQQWQAIGAECSGSIDSLVELLQGKLSKAVMQRICAPRTGLFPTPKEIDFGCSCPDSASMCKHVAAVLYGVGARLDQQPELLFRLRRVDAKDLVSQAAAGLPKSKQGPAPAKVLDASMLADVFGIEMDALTVPTTSARKKAASPKASASKAAKAVRETSAETNKKPRVTRKGTGAETRAVKTPAAKEPIRKRQSATSKLPAVETTAVVKTSIKKKPAKAAGVAKRPQTKKSG